MEKIEVKLIPRIRGKYSILKDKYGHKTRIYSEAIGMVIMIYFALLLAFPASFKLFFASLGLYFIYQEIISDFKSMARNFKR